MSIEKLKAHYGFSRTPFSKDLSPQMLYRYREHEEAAARIRWVMDEVAIGVISGEVGSGKTVAARAAASALDESRHTLIYLSNPAVGSRGIYQTIVSRLGTAPFYLKASLIAQAQELLEKEQSERGKAVTLILDEAHLLTTEQLEELRLLTNSEMDSASRFACLLLGQPTLRQRIKLGAFAALDQRIALRYHLSGMDLEETAGYVKHHLGLAGRSDPLFSDDAVALIHSNSRGLPRAVNNMAVQSLIAAFTESKSLVDESSARMGVAEVTAA